MQKKLNNKSLDKILSVNKIIKQPMTTRSELEYLAQKLNIPNVKVCWLKDCDALPNVNYIINLGNPHIGGSHWCATSQGYYFDPFGIDPPPQLENLQWTPLQIQSIRTGYCGNYCMLWLYYAIRNEQDQFYSAFDAYNTP